jgi:hypothetical protein
MVWIMNGLGAGARKPVSVVVFLGPSLELATARRLLEAEYRPPAARGDLLNAVQDGARIIGLIDGVFFQECAVAHREILYALERGVKVVGASSMGALRASELDRYGMEGVGRIYEQYKSGMVISDDEVALLFDPETLKPLSEPLVNIRYNLEVAENRGLLSREAKAKLLEVAKALYYPERAYDTILAAAAGMVEHVELARFKKFLVDEERDLKREDAIAALKRITELVEPLEH